FFFMHGKSGPRGMRYTMKSVAPIIRELHLNGWEIGLHVNVYHAEDTAEIIRGRKSLEEIIGNQVIGARFHWLRFDPRGAFRRLEEAGFLYDSTLGFHDAPGFRAGIAHAFHPYDPETGKSRKILEIPLAIMDCSLFEF